jgi:hypothetical protein
MCERLGTIGLRAGRHADSSRDHHSFGEIGLNSVQQRMAELMEPINRQIMMCDSTQEMLMIASAMMVSAKEIFDNHIGVQGRKQMFKDLS